MMKSTKRSPIILSAVGWACLAALLAGLFASACGPGNVMDNPDANGGPPLRPSVPPPSPAKPALAGTEPFPHANGARFERISTAQGLSFFTVRPILQDRQGFMWIGTYGGGLNKYDGYRFAAYRHDPDDPPTLSADIVFSLCEDRDGNLWVGTASGLDRLDRTTGTFDHFWRDPRLRLSPQP